MENPGQSAAPGAAVSARRGKLTAALVKGTIVGALGGLLFGFDTAVISGTTSKPS